jgi:hypothetical protein
MKYFFLIVLACDAVLFAAIHLSGEWWAQQVCINAFGLCEYETGVPIVGVLAIAMLLVMRGL